MEKLSIEQKVKAYDGLIERLKDLKFAYRFSPLSDTIEEKFPELRESEDERIRKELLEHCRKQAEMYNTWQTAKEYSKVQSWIAWLEKLGKQKLNPVLDIEIPLGAKDSELQEASYYIPEGFHAEIDGNRVVIKRGEQKPAVIIPKFRIGDYVKNVNDKREPIYEIVYMDKECYVCEYRGKENMGDKAVMHFSFDYPYLRHTHNTVWGEEDEINLEKAIWYVENPIPMVVKDSMLVEWLKSLKDRVQPQPNQEWSEEDERCLTNAIHACKQLSDEDYDYSQGYIDSINWLKSLKSRVGCKVNCTTARKWSGEDEELCEHLIKGIEELDPLPTSIYSDCKKWLKSLKDRYTWKPSDEQMDALHYVTNFDYGGHKAILVSLYEQLKKLK